MNEEKSFLVKKAVRAWACLLLAGTAQAAPADLPLIQITDMVYEGGCRLPGGQYGVSSLQAARGNIAYNPDNHSLFITGNGDDGVYDHPIGEFPLPSLVKSQNLPSFNVGPAPIQGFSTVVLSPTPGVPGTIYNPDASDGITSLAYFNGPQGPELLVNWNEYYDAEGNNNQTTLSYRQADNLAGSPVAGFFNLQGGPGHVAAWMSPIPAEWQPLLGGTHITGQSSGGPIISRYSVGPSAFAFNPLDIVGNASPPNPVPTIKLMDFSLGNPLASDLNNNSGNNDLWTHMSQAMFGMIVPGSRTYLTLGESSGQESGVCYKSQWEGGSCSYECGGYCPVDPNDTAQYYWLWDVNDLVKVKNGQMNSYDVRPYAYGAFQSPFAGTGSGTRSIGGASFDPASGILYMGLTGADTLGGGEYSKPPLILAFKFNVPGQTTQTPARPRRLRTR